MVTGKASLRVTNVVAKSEHAEVTEASQKTVQHDMAPEQLRIRKVKKCVRSVRFIHPPKCTMSFNFIASQQAVEKWV